METSMNEELRKLVQAIRRAGSDFNMSLPIGALKREAKDLIKKWNRLLAVLGN